MVSVIHKKGKVYMMTLLELAKGSTLDVITCFDPPPGTMALLSPCFQQIRHLEFLYSQWKDIITYSEISSGSLPLLSTLVVNPHEYAQPGPVIPPSLSFFGGAVNLKRFVFNSKKLNLLDHFNLITLELTAQQAWPSNASETFNASDLFHFLKASPILQTVEVKFSGRISLEGVPQEPITVLPNVETLSLSVGNPSDVYEIASWVSCPCAKHTSLNQDLPDNKVIPGLEIFPTPALWNMITSQYARGLVEEVALEIKPDLYGSGITCLLTFRSSDATTVRLASHVYETGEDDVYTPSNEVGWELFSRACSTIQNYPSLPHVKRIHIKYRAAIPHPGEAIPMSDCVGGLFDSMGLLDELTIHGCDLHIFLGSFLQDLYYSETPVSFPHIKELTILHPLMEVDEDECLDAIVDLAESQHEKGIPFERMTFRAGWLPVAMAERLMEWVDVVECYEEEYEEG